MLMAICLVEGQPQLNKINNHYYQLFQNNLTLSAATQQCSNSPYQGMTGYLATFTYYEELAFLKTLPTAPIWISGSSDGDGNWQYSSGPESGLLYYNTLLDKCYTYCQFGDAVFDANRNGLVVSNGRFVPTSPTSTAYYICEWGGLSDPVVSQFDANNQILFTNLNDTSSFTATFVNYYDSSKTITCASVLIQTPNSVICKVASGNMKQGLFKVAVKAGASTYNIVSSAQPPWIISVENKMLETGGRIYIYVRNLYIDLFNKGDYKFLIPNIGANPVCNYESYNDVTGLLQCTPYDNINRWYPIVVQFQNVSTTSYRAAFCKSSSNITLID
ncbi:hypothetical protein SAMD00019534_088160 [Acytostelium subglobosum LB1]|uniref:hypothetical protein n=1 Tax=Acytostelium subglobosum LB1 TaxID=1410327 RepID=UPI000644F714|nr:hypothetical protein SAMD00019534_088160 [Acytostelium subglobosum LB1]GAM25641.1 hypothetical protein SAMD00019534_088160 [Acytostelium subglobosum LB1]|eukprot:XP_012751627.1 hypothetical protein SAMD00019534_088160 [Acytostelium subglobosum LB1]